MDQLNLGEKVKTPSSGGDGGIVTQVFEATGSGEIAAALPGSAEKKSDGTFDVNESLNGDTILDKGAEGIGTALALQIRNPFLQTLAYTGRDNCFT